MKSSCLWIDRILPVLAILAAVFCAACALRLRAFPEGEYAAREAENALPAWAVPAGGALAAVLVLWAILARRKKKKASAPEAESRPVPPG